jgi:hypothetical protein
MTFHECYGELPTTLLRAIKRNNVSQSDYFMLEDEFGAGNFDAFAAAIKARSTGGNYNMPWPGHGHNGW